MIIHDVKALENLPRRWAVSFEVFTSSSPRGRGRSSRWGPGTSRGLWRIGSIPIGRRGTPVIPVIVVTRRWRAIATGRITWRRQRIFRWVVAWSRVKAGWWWRRASCAIIFCISGRRSASRRRIVTIVSGRSGRTSIVARRRWIVVSISWVSRGVTRRIVIAIRGVIARRGWGIVPAGWLNPVDEGGVASMTRGPEAKG